MNASKLKANYQANNPNGHFFDRATLRFFGDTMKNYGVVKTTFNGVPAFELFRRRPVKHGRTASAYFTADTFKLISY